MGRHSFVAPRDVKSPSAVRGIALAGAVGVLAGAGIPAATAAPQDVEGVNAQNLGEASVSFANAEAAPVEVAQNTVSLGGVTSGDWTIENVSVDVEEAPEPEPVVEEVAAPVAQQQAQAAPAPEPAPLVEVEEAPEPVVEAAAPSARGNSIVGTALAYQGAPYRWGGSSPSGWDCSGFVKWVYAQHGYSLPHGSANLRHAGRQVPYSQVQPGDILIWPGHAAISIGGGQNISALNPSRGTAISPDSWFGIPTVVRVG